MRTYKDREGCYLEIEQQRGVIRIGWYSPEDGEIGAYTGDRDTSPSVNSNDDERKILWELATADTAVEPFACSGKSIDGFQFETIKQARLALIAANTSLLSGGAPMPEWAVRATEAGWKPPKGWKP